MKPEDTANKLIGILGDMLQPYALTDKIIEEVRKGHPNMRNNVMMMLMEFGVEAAKRKEAVNNQMAEMRNNFGSDSKKP